MKVSKKQTVCLPLPPFHRRPPPEADAAPQIPGVKKMCRGKKTADHTSRGPGFLHSSNNVFVHSLKKSASLCPSKRPRAPQKFEGVFDASSCLKKLSDYKKDPLCRSIFVGILWEVA